MVKAIIMSVLVVVVSIIGALSVHNGRYVLLKSYELTSNEWGREIYYTIVDKWGYAKKDVRHRILWNDSLYIDDRDILLNK